GGVGHLRTRRAVKAREVKLEEASLHLRGRRSELPRDVNGLLGPVVGSGLRRRGIGIVGQGRIAGPGASAGEQGKRPRQQDRQYPRRGQAVGPPPRPSSSSHLMTRFSAEGARTRGKSKETETGLREAAGKAMKRERSVRSTACVKGGKRTRRASDCHT